MAASATPNAIRSAAWGPRSAETAGRQITSRTIAAKTRRIMTVPTGPTSSKSWVAAAAPLCTETIPPRTRAIDVMRPLPPLTPGTVRAGGGEPLWLAAQLGALMRKWTFRARLVLLARSVARSSAT